MSKRGLCIFDWNGTVQHDLYYFYDNYVCPTFAHFNLPCPTLDQYRNAVTADTMASVYWPFGVPKEVSLDDLREIQREWLEGIAPPELFPDAKETILAVRAMGYELMVASGYQQEKLDAAIARNGLSACFTHVIGNVKHKDSALLDCELKYYRNHREWPKHTAKVGDTVDDAIAAGTAYIQPFICSRGFHLRSRIEEIRSDVPSMVIIESLAELPALLA